jgi:uncharacterized protein
MNDLLKKLQSMGLKIEKGSDVLLKPDNKVAIDKIIKGEWLESQEQRIFISKKVFPFGSMHGKVSFENNFMHKDHARFWGIQNIKDYGLSDFLFLDTETTGLSLGAGSIVFLFGGCFFTISGLHVVQIFLDDPSNEELFLANIEELFKNHKSLVSYNGKSFDIPMLRSRMVLNHMSYGNLNKDHLDLLHFSRMIWKLRLESRRLSDIEREILDFQRTGDEVPGWLVPQIYQDYLVSGDATPLKGVFYHNEKDIVSLAALFSQINLMVSDREVLHASNSLDILSIGRIYQKSGDIALSEEYFKLGLEKQSLFLVDNKILKNIARLKKKQNKWSEALLFWEIAANKQDLDSCIEISKYFEHYVENYSLAIDWVEEAIKISESLAFPTAKFAERLNHRKRRLESKINFINEK